MTFDWFADDVVEDDPPAGRPIPAAVLAALRELGVTGCDDPAFGPDHRAHPWGHILEHPHSDAGALRFHRDGDDWVVVNGQYDPGPGPGDFVHRWPSADEAIADIADHFGRTAS